MQHFPILRAKNGFHSIDNVELKLSHQKSLRLVLLTGHIVWAVCCGQLSCPTIKQLLFLALIVLYFIFSITIFSNCLRTQMSVQEIYSIQQKIRAGVDQVLSLGLKVKRVQ